MGRITSFLTTMAKTKQDPPSYQRITSVWMLTREYGDLAGAGGVKDVAAQLATSLARWSGRKVRVVLPLYGFFEPREHGFSLVPDPLYPDRELSYSVAMDYVARERFEQVRIWVKIIDRVRVYLVEAKRFTEKQAVYTYTRDEFHHESWKTPGSGHVDFFAMNILLQKAGLDLMMLLGEKPQIIHCHDGHTATLPALIRECNGYRHYFRQTATLVTIHNAGIGYHQDVSDLDFVHAITGLPWRVISHSLLDHSFDPFIAAGLYSPMSTVSENYARELQELDTDYLTGWLGHRLLDMGVVIEGITNGINPADFDPADHERLGISAPYQVSASDPDLPGKRLCKEATLARVGRIPEDDDDTQAGYLDGSVEEPLFTFIGRLSDQKGVDIFAHGIELFLGATPRPRVLCLGSGEEKHERTLRLLANDERFRGRFCFIEDYDTTLANQIYAAGDFFVIPSRYEPCGLTDYIAQLFGNLPIAHYVGGLVKVVDGITGFTYHDNSPENLAASMERAIGVFDDRPALRDMQRAAVAKISKEHTWEKVMHAYVSVYKKSLARQIG
jgi:starch synthase